MSSQILITEKNDYDAHLLNMANPHAVTTSQIGAVPTTRTINKKALTSNITLTTSDVGFQEPAAIQIIAPGGVVSNNYYSLRFDGGLFYCKRGKLLEIYAPYKMQYWNNTTVSKNYILCDTTIDFFDLPNGYYNYDAGTWPFYINLKEAPQAYNYSPSGAVIPSLTIILAGSTLRLGHFNSINALPDFNVELDAFEFIIPLK